ncbi:MAG: DUF4382 domain-containing protein [Gemmatimonadales bacterium]|jgi:hypothetical protein
MSTFPRLRYTVSAVAVAAAVACSDSTGVDDTGDVRVTLAQSDAIITQVVSSALLASDAALGALNPDTIQSLTVTVPEIEFLQGAVGDNTADSSWVSLTLSTPANIDLMTLPVEGASPVVITSGSVAVGDYRNVRLFVSEASIVFTGPITLGEGAASYDGGTTYTVTVPSGMETGIKTDATFTVTADDSGTPVDVDLLFEPTSTFQNVTANGTGGVMLTPVIMAQPQGQ